MVTWEIKGYAGFSDYDGPEDYNFHLIFTTSNTMTEKRY